MGSGLVPPALDVGDVELRAGAEGAGAVVLHPILEEHVLGGVVDGHQGGVLEEDDLLEAVPGDALSERADKLPVESRTALYERYGLDKSMMERYVLTMKRMCRGDFGESFVYSRA